MKVPLNPVQAVCCLHQNRRHSGEQKSSSKWKCRATFLSVLVLKDIDLSLMLMDKSFQHFVKFCYNSQHSASGFVSILRTQLASLQLVHNSSTRFTRLILILL